MLNNFLPLIYVITFFIFIYIANSIIDYLLRQSVFGIRYRLFVAPGIIVHELSHALAALATGHRVEKINVFAPEGGYVVHSAPKEPFSQVFISLAPIIGITITFFGVTYFLQPQWLMPIDLHKFSSFSNQLLNISFSRWQTWLHLYLSLSLVTALAPSKQDLKVAARGIILIIIIISLLLITPLNDYITKALLYVFSPFLITIFLITITILFSFLSFLITAIIKKISHKN